MLLQVLLSGFLRVLFTTIQICVFVANCARIGEYSHHTFICKDTHMYYSHVIDRTLLKVHYNSYAHHF